MIKNICIYLAVLLCATSTTLVALVLPVIQSSLMVSFSQVGWVMISYSLAFALFASLQGRFSDYYSAFRVFQVSLIVSIFAALLAATANNIFVLVLARFIQGVSAAAIPIVSARLLIQIAPKEKIGFSLGLLPTVLSIGFMAGPIMGGFLLKYFNWHTLFCFLAILYLINFILAFSLRTISLERNQENPLRIDVPGMIAAGIFFFLLLYGISSKHILLVLLAGLISIPLIRYQLKCKHPFLPLRLLKDNVIKKVSLIGLLSVSILFLTMIFFPMYLKQVYNFNLTKVSYFFFAFSVGMAAGGPIGGRLSDKAQMFFPINLGYFIALTGALIGYFLYGNLLLFTASLVLVSLGATMVYAVIPKVINEVTNIKYFGETMGIVNVIMYLGQSFGANFASVIMDKKYLQSILNPGVKNISIIFILLSLLSIVGLFISFSIAKKKSVKNCGEKI